MTIFMNGSGPGCIHDGDLDGNGEITAQDALAAFEIALHVSSPTFARRCSADCNSDGTGILDSAVSVRSLDIRPIFGLNLVPSCMEGVT